MKISGYPCFVSMEGKSPFCSHLNMFAVIYYVMYFSSSMLSGYLTPPIIGGTAVQGIVGKDSITIDA